MTEAYPLAWPVGQPRTAPHARRRSNFDQTQDKAQKALMAEIKRLGGQSIVLSTNLKLRQDGLPYASQKAPDDTGVAVYFTLKGRQQCFACDRWVAIWENIWAICKTIEALRGIERWGSGDMMERAFTGFLALPPPITNLPRAWWDVLKVDRSIPLTAIEAKYRLLAWERQGDHNAMVELNSAIADARRAKTDWMKTS